MNDSGTAWPTGEHSWMEREGDVRLFIRSAQPATPPRATVILTHGLGEHSNRYGHVASEFVARGWKVVAWDLRGHGRSSGARGDMLDYAGFLDDLHLVSEQGREAGVPLFFYGHSMGAQITVRFLQTREVSCQGAIIASPWLQLAFDPPWWKLAIARLAMWIRPSFIQFTGNHRERLSRDLKHLGSFPDLDLVHHGISARMYFLVRAAAAQGLAAAASLRVPLLLLHGDDDPVTSHHSTCEFFEKVGSEDKTLRIFPGAKHETHNDLDRAQVIREVVAWIEARVPASPASQFR